jgi:hypothetical protein
MKTIITIVTACLITLTATAKADEPVDVTELQQVCYDRCTESMEQRVDAQMLPCGYWTCHTACADPLLLASQTENENWLLGANLMAACLVEAGVVQ